MLENLEDIISFAGFDYLDWRVGERDILTPRLIEAGFTDIHFGMGEADSFGPLTRICSCKDPLGNRKVYIYG